MCGLETTAWGAVPPKYSVGRSVVDAVMSSPRGDTLESGTSDDVTAAAAASKPQRRRTTPPKIEKIAPPCVAPMFGTLTKLGHRMPSWKSRHFVLVDGHVGYYDGSGPSKELKGEFTLTSDCEVLPSSKRPHCFALKGEGLKKKGGMFTVAGADEADKERWIQAFENHIRFVRDREAMDMDRVDYDFPA